MQSSSLPCLLYVQPTLDLITIIFLKIENVYLPIMKCSHISEGFGVRIIDIRNQNLYKSVNWFGRQNTSKP